MKLILSYIVACIILFEFWYSDPTVLGKDLFTISLHTQSATVTVDYATWLLPRKGEQHLLIKTFVTV